MASDTYIIKVLNWSPRISGKTNPIISYQEHCPKLFLLRYKDLHTILHHSVTWMDFKPRLNRFHEIVKPFTLHKLKRQLTHNYHLIANASLIFWTLYFAMTRLPTDPSLTCHSFLASKLSVDCDLSNLPNLPDISCNYSSNVIIWMIYLAFWGDN
jgi:hypothetical protein